MSNSFYFRYDQLVINWIDQHRTFTVITFLKTGESKIAMISCNVRMMLFRIENRYYNGLRFLYSTFIYLKKHLLYELMQQYLILSLFLLINLFLSRSIFLFHNFFSLFFIQRAQEADFRKSCRKFHWQPVFKTWKRLFAFHFALMPFQGI